MRKLFTALLFLLSFNVYAFSAWIDETTIPAPFLGQTGVVTQTNVSPINNGGIGKARLNFKVHKYAYEDPIVFPGQARAGHLHMFFGNSCINGASTVTDLMACQTSTMVGGTANKSGYWMPAIVDSRTGAIQKPYQTLLYYVSRDVNGAPTMSGFPMGLKMIAGDSKAMSAPATGAFSFFCGSSNPTRKGTYRLDADGNISTTVPQREIPNCFGGSTENLNLNFSFPSCWNGVDLDSANHKDHMAYPVQATGKCPTTHPVVLPVIEMVFDWHIAADFDTKYWRLSSDMYDCNLPGGYSMHADYFAAWEPKYMDMLLNNVLRPTKESGVGWIGVDPDTGIDLRFK